MSVNRKPVIIYSSTDLQICCVMRLINYVSYTVDLGIPQFMWEAGAKAEATFQRIQTVVFDCLAVEKCAVRLNY